MLDQDAYVKRSLSLPSRYRPLQRDTRLKFPTDAQRVEFGRLIKFQREVGMRLELEEVARLIDYTPRDYARIEEGYWYTVLTSSILKICIALDIKPEAFKDCLPPKYTSMLGQSKRPKRGNKVIQPTQVA